MTKAIKPKPLARLAIMKLVGHLSSVMREACRPWICATLPMQPAAQSLRIALVEHFKHGG